MILDQTLRFILAATGTDRPDPENPLASGVFCPTCGTRLNSGTGSTAPCPMCTEPRR